MAYQGEDIKFTIRGNGEIDLDNSDFAISVYPHCECEVSEDKIVRLTKSENFTPVKDSNEELTNTYIGTIPASKSSGMSEGLYNMELFIKNKDEECSIFKEKHALTIECAVSKELYKEL